MPLRQGRIQVDRVPEDPCIRFQLWYGGNKARRHTTETRARAVIKSIPAKLEGLKALEVGSAWGYLSFLMASYGATVTASDILVEDLLFGAKVREMNSGNGAVDFCAADALTLPFPDARSTQRLVWK